MKTDPSLPLANPRYEMIAQAIAAGTSAAKAYVEAGYAPGSAETTGPRLARSPAVKARVAALLAAADASARLEREEAMDRLVKIILAKPSDAGPDNPLCEIRMSKAGPYYAFPCKIECIRLLGKYCGWETGTQAENKAAGAMVTLTEQVAAIRAMKR
jgi:hypothetical protein